MRVSNEFVTYVIEQLAPFARVSSRGMFGGFGLYADGLFFALIADGTLYFKVDDSNRKDYQQRGSKPFVPFPDKSPGKSPGKSKVSMSYYSVPADLLDDTEELSRWARKSVAVALAAANKKVKRLPRKKTVKKKAGRKARR